MNSVRKICQHVSTNLQQQNSLIQDLQKILDSQQEVIQKQGHQNELLGDKLKCLADMVMDKLQEAVEDIKVLEYEEDGYSAVQYPQHTSLWDVEDGGDADESKEELLQDKVVTTQKVTKPPPLLKKGGGVPSAPTKYGTPPNRTKDVARYTTPHSSFESITEEERKRWDDCLCTPNHSTGKKAIRQARLKWNIYTNVRKRTASSTAVQEG